MAIQNKNDAMRFKAFDNSGRKYYAFRNVVMKAFDSMCYFTNEFHNLEMHHIDGDCTNNNGRNLIILRKDLHNLIEKITAKEFWKSLDETITYMDIKSKITAGDCLRAIQDKIMNPKTGKYPLRGKLQLYCPKCLHTAKILVSDAKSGRTVLVCVNDECIMLDIEFTAIYSTSYTE